MKNLALIAGIIAVIRVFAHDSPTAIYLSTGVPGALTNLFILTLFVALGVQALLRKHSAAVLARHAGK